MQTPKVHWKMYKSSKRRNEKVSSQNGIIKYITKGLSPIQRMRTYPISDCPMTGDDLSWKSYLYNIVGGWSLEIILGPSADENSHKTTAQLLGTFIAVSWPLVMRNTYIYTDMCKIFIAIWQRNSHTKVSSFIRKAKEISLGTQNNIAINTMAYGHQESQ